jgi:hypothetical protein
VAIEANLKNGEGRQTIATLASAFNVDPRSADKATAALADEVRARIERAMLSRGGVADVLSLVTAPASGATLELSENPASEASTDSGNHILDVLIGNKHISRGIAARVARQAGLDPATVEKMLPVVAGLTIEQLRKLSQPALEKLLHADPDLVAATGSGSAPPRGTDAPIDAGGPLPLPGDHIPGLGRQTQRLPDPENPYDRLPDIVRRGDGPQVPGGGSLDNVIRSIFGNLLGGNRGVIGTMIQLFLIRWLASLARRFLSRIATRR